MKHIERARQTNKLVIGVLGLGLLFSLRVAEAQTQTAATKSNDTVQTFYLTNLTQASDANEVTTALRNLLDPTVKIYLVPSQNAVTIRGSSDQIALAQKLITDLDRTKKIYRLTYTVTEMDGSRKIGVQHFALIVVSGGRTVMKEGSRVPVVTGAYAPANSTQKSDVTYLDVGLNVDASIDGYVDGVRLRCKIELSSVAEQQSGVGMQDPVIRQTLLEGVSILTQGKSLTLGSLDVPGSTRHLDIDVMMEPTK